VLSAFLTLSSTYYNMALSLSSFALLPIALTSVELFDEAQ
jgi:hypothetical protein